MFQLRHILLLILLSCALPFALSSALPSVLARSTALENTCQCDCCYNVGSEDRTDCVPTTDTSFDVGSCSLCDIDACSKQFSVACGQKSSVVNSACITRKGWMLRLVPIIFIAASATLLIYGLFFKTYDGYHPDTGVTRRPLLTEVLPQHYTMPPMRSSYGSSASRAVPERQNSLRGLRGLTPISETAEVTGPTDPSDVIPDTADTIHATSRALAGLANSLNALQATEKLEEKDNQIEHSQNATGPSEKPVEDNKRTADPKSSDSIAVLPTTAARAAIADVHEEVKPLEPEETQLKNDNVKVATTPAEEPVKTYDPPASDPKPTEELSAVTEEVVSEPIMEQDQAQNANEAIADVIPDLLKDKTGIGAEVDAPQAEPENISTELDHEEAPKQANAQTEVSDPELKEEDYIEESTEKEAETQDAEEVAPNQEESQPAPIQDADAPEPAPVQDADEPKPTPTEAIDASDTAPSEGNHDPEPPKTEAVDASEPATNEDIDVSGQVPSEIPDASAVEDVTQEDSKEAEVALVSEQKTIETVENAVGIDIETTNVAPNPQDTPPEDKEQEDDQAESPQEIVQESTPDEAVEDEPSQEVQEDAAPSKEELQVDVVSTEETEVVPVDEEIKEDEETTKDDGNILIDTGDITTEIAVTSENGKGVDLADAAAETRDEVASTVAEPTEILSETKEVEEPTQGESPTEAVDTVLEEPTLNEDTSSNPATNVEQLDAEPSESNDKETVEEGTDGPSSAAESKTPIV